MKESLVAVAASGPFSKKGYPVQSRFSLGDGFVAQWQSDTATSYAWKAGGDYTVRAQIRSAVDTFLVSPWSVPHEIVIVDAHYITDPLTPAGDTVGIIDKAYQFVSGSAVSNLGHPIEYEFTIAKTHLAWQSDSVLTYAWNAPGIYIVTASARSAIDTTVESRSNAHRIRIVDQHMVSPPARPQGPSEAYVAKAAPFSTGGASSNLYHALHYRFVWSQTDTSAWSADTLVMHAWQEKGVYQVAAQARSAQDTTAVSSWSEALDVSVE